MPHLIDFYEAHRDHRNQFEILAFHDGSAQNFKQLDEELVKVKKLYWHDRDLPFPILLDATGQTIKNYGVHAFPTTILIDPEGKLVGEANEELLEKKLPALPLVQRVQRALDRDVNFAFDDTPLQAAISLLASEARVPITFAPGALKTAGIDPQVKVPLTMSGYVSLRSALALLLDPFNLDCAPGADGLVVSIHKPDPARSQELSEPQRACAKRIDTVLGRKVGFDFHRKPLAEVVKFCEQLTQESFVLDPAARKAGRLKPDATVTGSAKDEPLGKALDRLLQPLGLGIIVRNEVILITPRAAPGSPTR